MNIPIITVTNQPERAKPLIDSAQKHQWNIFCLYVEWKGFGSKLIETYNFLKQHREIEQFVFCDAHDVLVFGNEEEFLMKLQATFGLNNIVLSAERGLWPPILHPFRSVYTSYQQWNRFDYPNSGLYFAPSKLFIKLFEKYPPFYEIDDQYWMNISYLLDRDDEDYIFLIDNFQSVFNSHSFIDEGEYGYENGRVQIMGNQPVFLHKNGQTLDEKLNQMLGI